MICINCGFNIAAGQKIQTEIGAAAPDAAPPVAGPPSGDAVPGGGIGNFPFSSGGSSGVARALANREDEEDHMKAEYKRPAIMIGVGFGLILFNAFVMPSYEGIKEAMDLATGTDTPTASARLAVVMLSVLSMIVQFPFIFVALIVVAKMFSTSFGNLGPCVLKVAAIAIVTTGFGDCLATLMDIVTGGFGAMAGMITFPINMGVFWALSSMLLDLDFFEMVVLFLIVYLLPTFVIMFVGIGLVTMF